MDEVILSGGYNAQRQALCVVYGLQRMHIHALQCHERWQPKGDKIYALYIKTVYGL